MRRPGDSGKQRDLQPGRDIVNATLRKRRYHAEARVEGEPNWLALKRHQDLPRSQAGVCGAIADFLLHLPERMARYHGADIGQPVGQRE